MSGTFFKNKCIPILLVGLFAAIMVFVSGITGRYDVVLPTFGALMTGGWLIQDNLWHYHRCNLLVSVTLASVVGLLISKLALNFGEWAAFSGIYLGFMLVAGILIAGRTQIYPCFGAMALPIIMKTTSWIYPVSVLVLGCIIVIVQFCLEKSGIRRPLDEGEFPDLPEHRRERALYYLRVSMGLVPVFAVILILKQFFYIDVHLVLQAPLFVTYATFCNEHSAFVRHPVQTWFQIILAVSLGAVAFLVSRMLNGMHFSFVGIQCMHAILAGIAVLCMLGLGHFFHKRFPPAISLAITPFLVEHPLLPLYVAVGAGYFIFIAWALRRHPSYESKDLRYLK